MARTILVVDDELHLLELMARILSKRGFEVKTASDGLEALQTVEQDSIDLALLDIRMGPMSGIQLLEQMKARQPGLKAIMMTGYPTNETRALALKNGASAYLTKPLDLQDLLKRIEALVPH